MSRLPQLERDLVDAAARRRRRAYAALMPRVVRPALALAALAAVVAGIALAAAQQDPEREVTGEPRVQRVPEATFAKSRELAQAEIAEVRPVIAHEQLPAVAERFEARTPYPPGRRDDFDWKATPADPRDMGAISAPSDVQRLVEYRAGCLWLRYWLDAHAAGDAGARADAVRILRESRRWPTNRNVDGSSRATTEAAERGDAARVRQAVRAGCTDRRDPLDRYEDAPPEQGYRYGKKPRTLARIGDRFAIVGYILLPPGREGDVCLDFVRVADGTGTGCHSPDRRVQGVESRPGGKLAMGATTEVVDAIEVRFRDGGREHAVPALLGRAEDPAALEPLGLRPFVFYVAELPPKAEPREAVATRDGREVWRARFP